MNKKLPPEYNITGQDYNLREHLRYSGPPIIDIHAHVTVVKRVEEELQSAGTGDAAIPDAADIMLATASEFGIGRTYSMCSVEDMAPLRQRFGEAIAFNGSLSKKPTEADDVVYLRLDLFLAAGIEIVKLWAAPRGRPDGLLLDAPWRIEALKRAQAAGIRVVMVHVGDPDVWWTHTYTDVGFYGTKSSQYLPLRKMLNLFPDMIWIAAHMGGDPEGPARLEQLLEEYPYLHFDTSATKWQVREVSRHRDAIRSLMCRYPDRFLFGSDLVTGPTYPRDHYISRYWCQRTLWESSWTGPSPIADRDYVPGPGEGPSNILRGVDLPADVLEKVYSGNARRLLRLG